MKQVSLIGMLEFTAGCGFLFAIGPGRPLALYGFTFAVLALWSLRVKHWAQRMALFHWLAAMSALLFGAACLEQAFVLTDPTTFLMNLWMWFGFALIVITPLAMVNGILFAIEAWTAPPRRRTS